MLKSFCDICGGAVVNPLKKEFTFGLSEKDSRFPLLPESSEGADKLKLTLRYEFLLTEPNKQVRFIRPDLCNGCTAKVLGEEMRRVMTHKPSDIEASL